MYFIYIHTYIFQITKVSHTFTRGLFSYKCSYKEYALGEYQKEYKPNSMVYYFIRKFPIRRKYLEHILKDLENGGVRRQCFHFKTQT